MESRNFDIKKFVFLKAGNYINISIVYVKKISPGQTACRREKNLVCINDYKRSCTLRLKTYSITLCCSKPTYVTATFATVFQLAGVVTFLAVVLRG